MLSLFIFSTFLDHVKNAFTRNSQQKNLLMDEYFSGKVTNKY